MSLDNVTPGDDAPQSFNVIIEIPMNADPIKYEVDKASGAIFVDRFMGTSMHYPTNYGYVPRTIAGDGDPAALEAMLGADAPMPDLDDPRGRGLLLLREFVDVVRVRARASGPGVRVEAERAPGS